MRTSFKTIVITPEETLQSEIIFIDKLFSAKLQLLHVRKPFYSKEELVNYLQQIPKRYYKRIVLHSHYELINVFKLKGAHLTAKSRVSNTAITLFKKNKIKIVSASFHTVNEIKYSRRKYEYVFLSPVFDSISKHKYKSNFNLEELNLFLKKNKNNIIALGGITEKNIETIREAGFSGAATLGYLWKSKNPVKGYEILVSKIK